MSTSSFNAGCVGAAAAMVGTGVDAAADGPADAAGWTAAGCVATTCRRGFMPQELPVEHDGTGMKDNSDIRKQYLDVLQVFLGLL